MGGFYVDCLSEHIVRNTSEVMKLLQRGTQQRTTAMTKMNKVFKHTLFFRHFFQICNFHIVTFVLSFTFRRVAEVMLYLQS